MSDPPNADPSARVYEMLWDCKHCGTRKLLGLTHRYCPSCGAPQNAESRYFPSDAERVKVSEHVYFGRDIVCQFCGAYNGRKSQHCKDCGAPLAEGKDAEVRKDQLHAKGAYAGETAVAALEERAPAPPRAPKQKRVWPRIALGVLGVFLLLVLAFFWKKEAGLVVAERSWLREIDVEQFGPVRQSAWCEQLPPGARLLDRSRAERRKEKVQDGEDCQQRKIDQGDGTFREQTECKPRYVDKPVYADRCRYELDEWVVSRTERAAGTIDATPTWPEPTLGAACTQVGCEREGERRETYLVRFSVPGETNTAECEYEEARWRSLQPGPTYSAKLSVVGGRVDCDSVAAK